EQQCGDQGGEGQQMRKKPAHERGKHQGTAQSVAKGLRVRKAGDADHPPGASAQDGTLRGLQESESTPVNRQRVSCRCSWCGCSFAIDLAAGPVQDCSYCGEENDLEECELYNRDTGERFDADELGLDPEEDQD